MPVDGGYKSVRVPETCWFLQSILFFVNLVMLLWTNFLNRLNKKRQNGRHYNRATHSARHLLFGSRRNLALEQRTWQEMYWCPLALAIELHINLIQHCINLNWTRIRLVAASTSCCLSNCTFPMQQQQQPLQQMLAHARTGVRTASLNLSRLFTQSRT